MKKKLLLITIIMITVLFIITCAYLYFLSHKLNWSSEVNAAIINSILGILSLSATIGVTAYFNIQTQRITIENNQKNMEMQIEIQKMNQELAFQQSRQFIRDRIIEKRLEIYPKINKHLANIFNEVSFLIGGSPFYDFFLKGSNHNDLIKFNKTIKENNDEIYKMIRENYIFIPKELVHKIDVLTMFLDGYDRTANGSAIRREKIITQNEFWELFCKYSSDCIDFINEELQLNAIEKDLNIFKE